MTNSESKEHCIRSIFTLHVVGYSLAREQHFFTLPNYCFIVIATVRGISYL